MTLSPALSIVIPVYNGAAWIRATLDSVLGQSFAAWEIVIVDDGSPEPVAPHVERYLTDPRIRLIRQPNGGADRARNVGFEHASAGSRFVLFLDQDDLLEATALAAMVTYLDSHPDVGLVFCDRTVVDAQNRVMDEYRGDRIPRFVPSALGVRRLRDDEPDTPFLSFFAYNIAVPSGALMRREAFELAGPWDERLDFYGDDDMWMRLALVTRTHYLPEPLLRRRLLATGISRSPSAEERFRKCQRIFMDKWHAPAWLPAEHRRMVAAAKRFKEGRVLPYLWLAWAVERARRRQPVEAAKCVLRAGRQLAFHGVRGAP